MFWMHKYLYMLFDEVFCSHLPEEERDGCFSYCVLAHLCLISIPVSY